MNIAEIESQLKDLVEQRFDPATFVFSLLEIYDAPKATVTKLKQGSANQAAKTRDLLREHSQYDILWKNKLFFRVAAPGQAAAAVDAMAADPLTKKHNPRFLLATDGAEIYCLDTKLDQSLDLPYGKLNDGFMFLLPLAGVERYEAVAENPADIKATGRLAKLYDAILAANPGWASHDHTHELNLLMTRLLFCFFAERTSIFQPGLFTSTVLTLTRDDGSDTASVLQTLFSAMNTPSDGRAALPDYARKFPYVNGGLFAAQTPIPTFSKGARRLLKECGDLSWHEINPDIFGSMIQAVVEPDMRGDMGMHYTSVPNIMKVLQPLFLLSLEEDLAAAWDSETKLRKLLDRLYRIRVFDPACGSGNFLIIAYRELRKLENKIFARLNEVAREPKLPMTGIKLNHFYGIELADFAVETAKLSMWIAEYQANEQFKDQFGTAPPALPLRDSGNIIHGNSTRLDWNKVCPGGDGLEIYVVGNPPYLGRADQTPEQKADMLAVFASTGDNYKSLDYVACWYVKSAEYCRSVGGEFALVTTNSVCQGEQVALLWPHLFRLGLEIGFAYQSFKWTNNASHNAAVTCVIIGIRLRSSKAKVLYSHNVSQIVKNISPYLVEGDDLIVTKSRRPLFFEKEMSFGSMANDGGHLILSPAEKDKIVSEFPEASRFMKRLYGSQEFTKGIERWCIWIDDADLPIARDIPEISRRIDAVRETRQNSDRETTRLLAGEPHRFGEIRHKSSEAVLIPQITSERRYYITAGIVNSESVITNLAFAVYDAEPYIFSILSSTLHYVWGSAVGGRFKTDPRYSNTLVYNTFPVPRLSDQQKAMLEDHAVAILGAREAHPGKTIAWLYDPETMPADLLQAHRDLDEALETIYLGRPFKSDAERLEHLFKLYSALIKKQAGAPAKKTLAAQGAA
jgi:hypothetical protein